MQIIYAGEKRTLDGDESNATFPSSFPPLNSGGGIEPSLFLVTFPPLFPSFALRYCGC